MWNMLMYWAFRLILLQSQLSKPRQPRETIRVRAIRERDQLEIKFPKVEGYRTGFRILIYSKFHPDHSLRLTPELVGPSIVDLQGIIGKGRDYLWNTRGICEEALSF